MNGKGVVLVVVLMFALALGAGAALGKLLFRSPPNHATQETVRGTLSDVLHLTAAQNSQMQQIWQDVSHTSSACIEETKNIQIDEDKELVDHILATDEQKESFQALRNRSKARLDALARKRDAAFNKAVEQTLQILNDEQRGIYNQIIQDRIGALPSPSLGGR